MLIDCTHQTPVNLDPFQFLDHVHRKPKSIAKMHVTERNMINQHIMELFPNMHLMHVGVLVTITVHLAV